MPIRFGSTPGSVCRNRPPATHVLIFGGARGPGMVGLLEVPAIADAEPIVHRQHDEAVRGEILVHRIGVAVVVHVVPAEQHLPRRPAVDEDDAGLGRRAASARRSAVRTAGHEPACRRPP